MKLASGLRHVLALGVISSAGFLSACSGDMFDETPIPACPKIYVPNDTASVTVFDGKGRDLTDTVFSGKIVGYQGDCGYDLDDRKLNILISPVVNAERGPAATGRDANFKYFVALRDPDGNFVQKSTFNVDMTFPDNLNQARYRDDQVSLDVPLKDVWAGPDYEVYLGFQLTKDELDYNRRFDGQ